MHRVDIWDMVDGWGKAAIVMLSIAVVAQTGFVLLYATRPWYVVRVGRALMLKSSALLVALWTYEINTWFLYPHQAAVSALSLGLVAGAICYQLWVLWREPNAITPPEAKPRHAGEKTPS